MKVNVSQLLHESNLIDQYIKTEIQPLNILLLTSKPNEETWSVIEVLQHLNLVYDLYFTQLKKAIAKYDLENEPTDISDDQNITWIVQQMAKMQKPKNGHRSFKMTTFKFFIPQGLTQEAIQSLNTYLSNREQFNDIIKLCRRSFASSIIITSAIKILKFTMPEAVVWLLAHEQRHIVQIQEILLQVQKI